jgi:hypothetical protein
MVVVVALEIVIVIGTEIESAVGGRSEGGGEKDEGVDADVGSGDEDVGDVGGSYVEDEDADAGVDAQSGSYGQSVHGHGYVRDYAGPGSTPKEEAANADAHEKDVHAHGAGAGENDCAGVDGDVRAHVYANEDGNEKAPVDEEGEA